jgi:hypothetical protein
MDWKMEILAAILLFLALFSSNAGAAVTKAFGDVMKSKGLVWTSFLVTLTPPNYGITFTTPLPRGIFH